jgi:hypothetical protein
MHSERRTRRSRKSADKRAVRLEPRLVFRPQSAGVLGQPGRTGFRIAELEAALIGKSLLGRIEDLQEVHACAAGRQRPQALAHRFRVGKEVAQDHDLGEAADSIEPRPVVGHRRVCENLGEPIGSVAAEPRLGEARDADTFAAAP